MTPAAAAVAPPARAQAPPGRTKHEATVDDGAFAGCLDDARARTADAEGLTTTTSPASEAEGDAPVAEAQPAAGEVPAEGAAPDAEPVLVAPAVPVAMGTAPAPGDGDQAHPGHEAQGRALGHDGARNPNAATPAVPAAGDGPAIPAVPAHEAAVAPPATVAEPVDPAVPGPGAPVAEPPAGTTADAAPVAAVPAAPSAAPAAAPAGSSAPAATPTSPSAGDQRPAPQDEQPPAPVALAGTGAQTAPAEAEAEAAPARASAPATAAARPSAPDVPVRAERTEAPVAAAPAAPAAPVTPATPGEPAAGLRRAAVLDGTQGLLELAARHGMSRARLTLRPQELGGVEVRLLSTPMGLAATVRADSEATAQTLQAAAGELRQSLQDAGVTVSRIEVSWTGHDHTGAFGQDGRPAPEDRRTGGGRPSGRAFDLDDEGDVLATPVTSEPPARRDAGAYVDVSA